MGEIFLILAAGIFFGTLALIALKNTDRKDSKH